jgi:hypothetical protein
MPKPKPKRDRIAELEDELKQRDRRINDLKADISKLEDLVTRQDEHVRDCGEQIERWVQAFDMVQDAEGVWKWRSSFVEGQEWFEKYRELLKEWNRFVPDYNAAVRHRNVGRPLAASDAQVEQVLKLHKQGSSLRDIAEETSLGLRTVRTIIDRPDWRDRTSRKHLDRIKPDVAAERAWLAKSRMRAALPKSINATRKTCDELHKEARGLVR